MVIPLAPILYVQGKMIRKKVPVLPEAEIPIGSISLNHGQVIRLITLGESTIAGVGVEKHKDGFTGTLAQELSSIYNRNVNWNVWAKSGYTAKDVNQEFVPQLARIPSVDIIVIGLGGNDAFTLNRPWKWKSQILRLIQNIRKIHKDTPIVFINMPPIKLFPAFTKLIQFFIGNLVELHGKTLHYAIRDACFQNVHYYHQVITFQHWSQQWDLVEDPDLFFSDGVHPSQLTYQLWAKDIAAFIRDKDILKPFQ